MHFLEKELESLHEAKLYRSLRTIHSDQDSLITTGDRQFINFSSNNYLGLANHPRLKEAAIAATERFGTGSGASRLITGSMQLHHELEKKLARFKGCEAALVFNSGYHANLGVLTSLLGEGDVVFSDELNHASIVDGCRLSRAKVQVYRHGDVGHLEELLTVGTGFPPSGHRLIVTDSIFSMDGDAAPLKELAGLAERYDAWLMVDEAHATGVFGPTGKGLVEELLNVGATGRSPLLIQMGTLGKALGSFGAYVAGSRSLIEFLINKARPFIYTTALPPGVLAAALAAIEIVEQEPERCIRLWENVEYLCSKIEEKRKSPIIPWVVGDSQKVLELSEQLFEAGLWVTAIRTPTVPRGTERLRITLMATHTREQIDQLVKALHAFR
jgi:8-amino-7-oxononanoate synthase